MQYVVKSGDSLSKIAQSVYGDMSRWTEILNANPQVTNANVIQVGQTLEIPEDNGNVLQFPQQSGGSTDVSDASGSGMDWMKIGLIVGGVVLGYFVIKMIAEKREAPAEEPAHAE